MVHIEPFLDQALLQHMEEIMAVINAEMDYFKLRKESFPTLLLTQAITGEQMKDLLRSAWFFACAHAIDPSLEEGDPSDCEITGMDWTTAVHVAIIAIESRITLTQKKVIVRGFKWQLKKSRTQPYDILNMPFSIFILVEQVVNIVKHPIPTPSLN